MDRLLREISKSWPLKVAAYLLAWTVPGLISATQLLMSYSLRGDSAPLLLLAQITFPTWYAWAALAPLIYAAARRFPLDGDGWVRSVPIHLLLNAVLLVISVALVLVARRLFNLPAMGGPTLVLVGSINTSLLTYWTIVLVAHAVRYFEEGRARALREAELAAQLSEARLEALRAQLHPHFLFNTMHAISAFVRDSPDKAEDMLAALADLLRTAIERTDAQIVPLAEEIDFIEKYLSLQQTRLGERLSLDLRFADELADIGVPAMLLQPLVENAVEHGIARRRGTGKVAVHVVRDGQAMRLEVSDDGPGLDPEERDPTRWRVGLHNTRERLRQLYGDAHTLEFVDLEPQGLMVRVLVPLQPAVRAGS